MERSRMRLAGLAALLAVGCHIGGLVGPADAQGWPDYTLEGTAECSEEGERVITWELENRGPEPMTSLSFASHAHPDGPQTTDSPLVPDPLPVFGTATATTTLDGGFVGTVEGEIEFVMGTSSPFQDWAEVELTAPCPAPTTTTAAPTTTSAVQAAPAAAEVETPTFTG